MAEVTLPKKLAAEFVGTAALVICGPGPPAGGAPVPRCSSRRSSARPPRRAPTWLGRRHWRGRSTTGPAGKPGFELGDDEIELGVGIHGEPGRTRGKLVTAEEIAAVSLNAIHADMPRSGDVLVMVNGLGGTPLIELYVVFAAVSEWLAGHGVTIARSLVGNYITSLEMAGCSITVCRLTPQLAELWDAPVETPALRWGR